MIGGLSHRSLKKESFTGQAVGWRTFKDVRTALIAANYLAVVMKNWTEFLLPKGDADGCWSLRHSERVAPTEKLLGAASDAGIDLADVRRHFVTDPEANGKETEPIVIERLKVRRGRDKIKAGRLPLPQTAETEWLKAEVEGFNDFAASHLIALDGERIAPRWHREFTLNYKLNGRWYVRGTSYQGLSGAKRVAALTIDGEAVAEIDLSASWLTVLYGHLNVPFNADQDPYTIHPHDRSVVKTWVIASLGKGEALTCGRWPAKVVKDASKHGVTTLTDHLLPDISAAVLKRHPIMANLPERFASLAWQFRVPRPQDVFALFLMGLEARAMTAAMMDLKKRSVPALTVQDSLIVPQSAVEMTKVAMTAAFGGQLGITPRLKVNEGGL
jgi:hypothetical protein